MEFTVRTSIAHFVFAETILRKRLLFQGVDFNNGNGSIASPAIRVVVDRLVPFLKVALLLLELLLIFQQLHMK